MLLRVSFISRHTHLVVVDAVAFLFSGTLREAEELCCSGLPGGVGAVELGRWRLALVGNACLNQLLLWRLHVSCPPFCVSPLAAV